MAIPTNIKTLLSGNVVEAARIEYKETWDANASPKTIAKDNKEKIYYIRKGSSSMMPSDDEQKDLFQLANKVPFDGERTYFIAKKTTPKTTLKINELEQKDLQEKIINCIIENPNISKKAMEELLGITKYEVKKQINI